MLNYTVNSTIREKPIRAPFIFFNFRYLLQFCHIRISLFVSLFYIYFLSGDVSTLFTIDDQIVSLGDQGPQIELATIQNRIPTNSDNIICLIQNLTLNDIIDYKFNLFQSLFD